MSLRNAAALGARVRLALLSTALLIPATAIGRAPATPRGPTPTWYATVQLERVVSGTYGLRLERTINERAGVALALTLGRYDDAEVWASVARYGAAAQAVWLLAGRHDVGVQALLNGRLLRVDGVGRAEMTSQVWHAHVTALLRARYVTRRGFVVALGLGGGVCAQRGEVSSPVERREVRETHACVDGELALGYAF